MVFVIPDDDPGLPDMKGQIIELTGDLLPASLPAGRYRVTEQTGKHEVSISLRRLT